MSHEPRPVGLALGLCLLLLAPSACKKVVDLVVDAPTLGAFTTASTHVVSGRVVSYNATRHSLELDGVAVPVQSDNTFSTTLTLDTTEVFTVAELDLLDAAGDLIEREVLVVGYASTVPVGDPTPESLSGRVTQSALQDVVTNVFATAAGLDDGVPIEPNTTIVQSFCVPHPIFPAAFPCHFDLNASVTSSSVGALSTTLTAVPDALDVGIDVDDLEISVHLFHNPNPNVICDLDLSGSIDASGQVAVEPAADPKTLDVDLQDIEIEIVGDLVWSVSNGVCDSNLLADTDWIEELLGIDVEPFVEGTLETLLNDPDGAGPQVGALEELLDAELATLELGAPIEGILENEFGLEVDLEANFEHVTESSDGVDVGLDLSVEASNPDPLAPVLTDVVSVGGTAPIYGATTPVGLVPYHAALSVAPDALNQSLAALTESGLARIGVSQVEFLGNTVTLDGGLLAVLIDPSFGDVTLGLGAEDFEIRVDPRLAPVVTGVDGPTGEPLDVRLAGLELEFVQLSTGHVWLTLMLDARAGLALGFDDLDKRFLPSVSDLTVGIHVAQDDVGVNLTVVPSLVEMIVTDVVLQPILDTIEAGFPTVAFAGYELTLLEAVREGTYVSAYVELTPVP